MKKPKSFFFLTFAYRRLARGQGPGTFRDAPVTPDHVIRSTLISLDGCHLAMDMRAQTKKGRSRGTHPGFLYPGKMDAESCACEWSCVKIIRAW